MLQLDAATLAPAKKNRAEDRKTEQRQEGTSGLTTVKAELIETLRRTLSAGPSMLPRLPPQSHPWPAAVCLVCWPTAAWPLSLSSSAAPTERPASAATLSSAGQTTPVGRTHTHMHTLFRGCFFRWLGTIWLGPLLYPDGSQQADVICDDFGEAKGVVRRLVLVQLLHLVLHLCQLRESSGQSRVVLRTAQHGRALGEAGCV